MRVQEFKFAMATATFQNLLLSDEPIYIRRIHIFYSPTVADGETVAFFLTRRKIAAVSDIYPTTPGHIFPAIQNKTISAGGYVDNSIGILDKLVDLEVEPNNKQNMLYLGCVNGTAGIIKIHVLIWYKFIKRPRVKTGVLFKIDQMRSRKKLPKITAVINHVGVGMENG
jgi:hypothetical protein